jgi:DNA replication protein DnaC
MQPSSSGAQRKLASVKCPSKSAWQAKWLALSCHCPQLEELGNAAEGFCARWVANDVSLSLLLLMGKPDCGKTHVARKIDIFCRASALYIFEKGKGKGKAWPAEKVPSVIYMSWPEVTDQMKTGYYGMVEDMVGTDMLVLDDVGAEHDPSKNAVNKLCQILTRRERRFTVITTNLVPTAWGEMLDPRIASRFLRNSVVVDLFNVPEYSLVK